MENTPVIFTTDNPITKIVADILNLAVERSLLTIELKREGSYVSVVSGTKMIARMPVELEQQVIDRFKILADLKVSEKNIYQEGSFTMTIGGKKIRINVGITPDQSGEKILVTISLLMKSQEDYLIVVTELGKEILLDYKDKSNETKIYAALMSLLYIERVIDGGRILLDMPEKEALSRINKGLDEIRAGIVGLMSKLDQNEIKTMLFSAGEQLKLRFQSRTSE